MEYLTTLEMSEKWGISARRIALLCEQERIEGVIKKGKTWLIPKDAEKPEDIMEQNGKQVESVGEYLCGIYDNRVKRKEAVTLADLCYAWENERSIPWIPKAP